MSERVVGWVSDEEWICTYQKLFCGNMKDQYDALDIINLWRARFCSKIPVAIDATSRLLESWLESNKVTRDAKRQLMSAAVTQFVGLVTERGLKGNTKKPIHEVGEDFGIPEWLINLRHEMAHGPLPTSQMLEKAVVFALDWLKDNHWDVQYKIAMKNKKAKQLQCSEVLVQKNGEEMILKLLLDYVTVLTRKHVNITVAKRKKKASAVVRNLELCIQDDIIAEKLCTYLVERKFLVAYPKLLLLKPGSSLNIQCFNFWKPILELIRHRQLVFVLVCKLVSAVSENHHGTQYHNLFCSWTKHVLGKIENHKINENLSKELYSEWMISTTKLSLQKCECCQYLIGAIKDKFNDPVNSDKGILMSQLLKSSSKPDFQNSLDETHLLNRTYKLEDITRPMLLHPKPNDTINPVHSGPWKVYDGEPLLQIGLLPGQCITDLHESVMGPSQTVSDNVTDVCFQDDLSMSTDISTRTESVATGLASFTQNDWNCLETMINSC